MRLAPGSRLGAYEIVAAIGAGGMGEVYRARDSRLDRDVAIKILPEQFASDRDRVARFEREAKTLATLNHSHIAQIYGFEQSHSTSALVMELVDGEDLSTRIARGPIPIDDALAIATQIADALDAAHGQGIIHRDLKPGNIKITHDGMVKVLDFGLAKAVQPGAGSGESGAEHALANSPTITSPAMTMRGVILGTAGYMAPEQAKGRPVDKRADIWAFGCIVYEMVTGQRAFPGDDVSETIAAVLKTEPDWSRVPASIKPLLGSCLQKDSRRRLRDIGDALLLLEPPPSPSQPARSSSRFAWSIAGVTAAAAIVLAIMQFGTAPAPPAPVEFDLSAPDEMNFGDSYLTVSPDGRRIAHTLRDAAGVVRLWVRDLDDRRSRLLQGTEGSRSPFWSPDSRSLAFVVGNQLHRIEVDGGTSRLVGESQHDLGVGSWGVSGTIIVGSRQGGAIYRVPETGGPLVPVTALDLKRVEGFHAMPTFLRDGKRFLYLRNSADEKLQGLFAGSLDVAPEQQPLDMIVHTDTNAGYFVPATGPSWVLFVDAKGNLMSQQFDESVPAVVGSPVLEAERIGSAGSYAFFSVSSNGVLAYRGGAAGGPSDAVMTWFDRRGQRQAVALDRGAYVSAKLSPDGARIATSRNRTNLAGDIWLTDLTRGIDTRLTSDPAHDLFPIWSPDSSRILFESLRPTGRGLYEKRVDGVEPERFVLENRGPIVPSDWSPDGRFVLVSESPKLNAFDLSVVQLEPSPTKTPLLNSSFNEGFAMFSPDGRYFAYVSDESGRDEVYVSTFTPPGATPPAGAGKWRVSNDGGQRPRWRRDGKELFYRNEARVMSVAIDTAGPSLSPGKPVELFAVTGSLVNQWDVAADGQRFLMPLLPIGDASEPIRVTLNWRPGRQQP